jgi:hypothetical protein
MRYFGTVLIIVACAISYSFSNAQEPSTAQMPSSTPDVTASPETIAQLNPRDVSPDKKWEYIGGDEPKIAKAGTNELSLDLSDCAETQFGRRIPNALLLIVGRAHDTRTVHSISCAEASGKR